MMPRSGGYYQWVKEALGLRWAFFEGWWTWLYTFVDLAIYPVFLVEYAAFFFPQIAAYKVPVCLAVVWITAFVNIRGILTVGRSSLALLTIVLLPFGFLLWAIFAHPLPLHAAVAAHPAGRSAWGMALYTIIWNYIGWDNATTYADEVQQPAKTYLPAMGIAFAGIYVFYLLSTYALLHSGLDPQLIEENGFPYVAEKIGGRWLGALMSVAGMASMLGIFNSILLSVSRIPAVMSDDQLLPSVISRHHPKFNTPYVSIILCSSIVSFLVLLTFADLLVIDITLYACGLMLEFVSLLVLRVRRPEMPRPFRIPLSLPGLVAMACLPLLVFSIALYCVLSGQAAGFRPALFAIAALASAEPVWRIVVWWRKR